MYFILLCCNKIFDHFLQITHPKVQPISLKFQNRPFDTTKNKVSYYHRNVRPRKRTWPCDQLENKKCPYKSAMLGLSGELNLPL